ncbi:MAG: hypothetical protein QM487_02230 [Candidatus Marithrix sp.]
MKIIVILLNLNRQHWVFIRNFGFNLLIMEGFKSITDAMAEMEGKIDKLWCQ